MADGTSAVDRPRHATRVRKIIAAPSCWAAVFSALVRKFSSGSTDCLTYFEAPMTEYEVEPEQGRSSRGPAVERGAPGPSSCRREWRLQIALIKIATQSRPAGAENSYHFFNEESSCNGGGQRRYCCG